MRSKEIKRERKRETGENCTIFINGSDGIEIGK
jgi:hypothetical protein